MRARVCPGQSAHPLVPCGVDLSLFCPLDQETARNRLGLNGEKILLYVYENRPRPNLNISELMGFENRGQKFDLNLAQGQIAERELADILAGKIEVKCDARVSQTGNLVVEYACSGKPSGISTSQSIYRTDLYSKLATIAEKVLYA